VQLQEIVAGGLVRAHELHGRVRVGRAVAVERRRGDEHRGPEDLALLQLPAQHELIGSAEHGADGGDAVRDVQEHDVAIQLLRLRRSEHVRVHLGEAGHEVLATTIDALRVRRHANRR
jgi:hypothetical protein